MQLDPVRLALRATKRRASPAAYLCAVSAFVAIGAVAAWAAVHTRLESSIPSADQVLSETPERFELRFSGPVNEALSLLVLLGPAGDSVQVSLRRPGEDERILVGDFPATTDGEHLVRWRTVSADGHPVAGEFGFVVARAPAAAAGIATPPASDGTTQPMTEVAAESAEVLPSAGAALLAGLGLVCLLAFAGLLWYCGGISLMQEPRIARVARWLGWGALILIGIDFIAWLKAAVPPGGGLAAWSAAIGSRTGVVGVARLALTAGGVAALTRSGRAAAGLALVALLTGAAAGHAAGISPWVSVPANAIHLGAVSVWLGGLLLLLLVPDGPTDGSGRWHYDSVLRAVSGAALLSVLLITASGMVQSAVFVGDLAAFTGTTYGRGVLLKWAGLIMLIGFGAYHRSRTIPAVQQDADSRGLRRTVRFETIVMLVVVMVAAWLARVSPPAGY